jgi:outer membrane murein-binding lipoprotein Lpp
MMKSSLMLAAATAAALVLSGCGEINQQEKMQKVYAGKKDEKPYDGQQFGADRTKWEVALNQRGQSQNEYLRTEPAR